MTALAHTLGRRDTAQRALVTDVALVVGGSLVVAGLAQVYITLPFTPVPITGQTLGVLLVGTSLGWMRGAAAMLLYLLWGAIGLPFFAEGESGTAILGFASANGGYLWGFVVAALVVGWLAQQGWDRRPGSALGAMLIGEIIIFTTGVVWLAYALDVPITGAVGGDPDALDFGLYPFIVGDVIKLLLAAGLLPTAWRLLGRDRSPSRTTASRS
jgi:biotin transport system substrate-specific component